MHWKATSLVNCNYEPWAFGSTAFLLPDWPLISLCYSHFSLIVSCKLLFYIYYLHYLFYLLFITLLSSVSLVLLIIFIWYFLISPGYEFILSSCHFITTLLMFNFQTSNTLVFPHLMTSLELFDWDISIFINKAFRNNFLHVLYNILNYLYVYNTIFLIIFTSIINKFKLFDVIIQ